MEFHKEAASARHWFQSNESELGDDLIRSTRKYSFLGCAHYWFTCTFAGDLLEKPPFTRAYMAKKGRCTKIQFIQSVLQKNRLYFSHFQNLKQVPFIRLKLIRNRKI